LRDALIELPTPEQKFAYLEKQLTNYCLDGLTVNPFVDFAIPTILSNPHQLSIRSVADRVGYSKKHIIKLFKDQVGVSPKEFLKVIRL
jgi:AraC-like DNA-binding protein